MRLHRTLEEALVGTGLPWEAKYGSKHIKLFLNKRLVGICPINGRPDGGHALENVLAQIRRAARSQKEA